MHFLFFSAQYLPTVGGAERYTNSLALQLLAMGHRATVVTSALPGLPMQETDPDGITIVRLPSYLFINGRLPWIRQNKAFRTLAQQLFSHSYDFAIINTRFYPLSIWAAAQCKKHAIPALVLEHGTKHLSLDNAVLNVAVNLYEHTAMRAVRRNCDVFYGVSQACCTWLQHFHVQAQGVLYNAVNTQAIRAFRTAEPSFRARYALPQNAPIIAFIGRFIIEKGINELLAAFALLQKRCPDAVLIMAGDGPLLPTLRQAPPPGVYFTGALPHDECMALLAQADVFCLPTYSEGFSTTILEAAASGCYIVTTPTGGSTELICDGQSGTLLPNLQPATLADALQQALQNPALRTAAAEKARAAVEARFSWQATANALLKAAQKQLPATRS